MQASGYFALRHSFLQALADVFLMPVKPVGALSGSCSEIAAYQFAFRLEASECLFGALGNEVALYLGGYAESKGQHFRLNVIAETVAVFDSPYLTAVVHAVTQYLHNHEESAPEAAQFGGDDQIPFPDIVEKCAEFAFFILFRAGDGLFYPAVNGEVISFAELCYLKSLVFYCLFFCTDTYISVIHGF